jgi:hypothetical protein
LKAGEVVEEEDGYWAHGTLWHRREFDMGLWEERAEGWMIDAFWKECMRICYDGLYHLGTHRAWKCNERIVQIML